MFTVYGGYLTNDVVGAWFSKLEIKQNYCLEKLREKTYLRSPMATQGFGFSRALDGCIARIPCFRCFRCYFVSSLQTLKGYTFMVILTRWFLGWFVGRSSIWVELASKFQVCSTTIFRRTVRRQTEVIKSCLSSEDRGPANCFHVWERANASSQRNQYRKTGMHSSANSEAGNIFAYIDSEV